MKITRKQLRRIIKEVLILEDLSATLAAMETADALRKLASLRDAGVISDTIFATEKATVLAQRATSGVEASQSWVNANLRAWPGLHAAAMPAVQSATGASTALVAVALAEIALVTALLAWEGKQAYDLWKTINDHTKAAVANAFKRSVYAVVSKVKSLHKDSGMDEEQVITQMIDIAKKFRSNGKLNGEQIKLIKQWASHPKVKPLIEKELDAQHIAGMKVDTKGGEVKIRQGRDDISMKKLPSLTAAIKKDFFGL
jgi:hypothetical protein